MTAVEEPHTTLETVVWRDGSERQIVRRINAAAIVPLMLDEDDVLWVHLVHQWREPINKKTIEIPAGVLDHEGESPKEAAVRECGEETGLRPTVVADLPSMFPSPGYSSEELAMCCGWNFIEVEKRLEDHDLGSEWFRLIEAIDMVHAGQIQDGKTREGLLHVQSLIASYGLLDKIRADSEASKESR